MDPITLEEWIEIFRRKLQEQEQRIQELEARVKELEARIQGLNAELHNYKQRVALMERILMEKGLLPPDLSAYARWLDTIH